MCTFRILYFSIIIISAVKSVNTHTHNVTRTRLHTHLYTHTHQHALTYVCTWIHKCTHTHTQAGHTALYSAASNGCEDIVEMLLQSKADPDLTDTVI